MPLEVIEEPRLASALKTPLVSSVEGEDDDDKKDLGVEWTLHAPHSTKIWLQIWASTDKNEPPVPVCELKGRVDEKLHEESWYRGLRYLDNTCNVATEGEARGTVTYSVMGSVVMPGGAHKMIALTESGSIDPERDQAELVIHADGDVRVSIGAKACPWIYVDAGRGWERRVEVIQNLDSKRHERTQSVRLGSVLVEPGGRVRLQLREELDEHTYLDALTLDVNGLRLHPVGIEDLAAVDGSYLEMVQGDIVELVFLHEALAGERSLDAVITATGYYLPSEPEPAGSVSRRPAR